MDPELSQEFQEDVLLDKRLSHEPALTLWNGLVWCKTQRVNTIHIMCADYKESVLTFIQAWFYKEVLQLLPLSSINFLFAKKHVFFQMNH